MRILFVSASKYPSNTAEAMRLHFLAKLFTENGNEVYVVSRGTDETDCCDGISHTSLSNSRLVKGNRVFRAIDFYSFTRKVKAYLQTKEKYGAIIICAMPTSTLKYLIRYAKKNDILLIHDAVEWYSSEEFTLGRLEPLYRKKEKWMRKLLPGNCRIIAISRYLQKYFEGMNMKSVYIPSILDTRCIQYNTHTGNSMIRIAYAGTPLKKDYLSTALEGIAMLSNEEISRLDICIMGISADDAQANGISPATVSRLGNSLHFIGKVPRNIVMKELEKSDFSILLRPTEQRYAKAGFPTKVPESLSTGTPVICNYSSDLGDFLADCKNCMVVSTCSSTAMADCMKKVLKLDRSQINHMAKRAREVAEHSFDYRCYKQEARSIIE